MIEFFNIIGFFCKKSSNLLNYNLYIHSNLAIELILRVYLLIDCYNLLKYLNY